jgi:hypothetical protein
MKIVLYVEKHRCMFAEVLEVAEVSNLTPEEMNAYQKDEAELTGLSVEEVESLKK